MMTDKEEDRMSKDCTMALQDDAEQDLREELLPKEEAKPGGAAKHLAIAGAVMILLYFGGFLALLRGHHQTLLRGDTVVEVEEEEIVGQLIPLRHVPPRDFDAEKVSKDTKKELAKWRERVADKTDPALVERRDAVKAFLVENEISSSSLLEQEDSPQTLACEYLASLEDLELQPADGIYAVTTRYVLALLYFATGPWERDLNFLSSANPCYWYSVIQHGDTSQEFRGTACLENGEIAALFLKNNTMRGQLPSELGLLTTLAAIDIKDNALTGDIPEQVAALPNLHNFFAGNNGLHNTGGPVPAFSSTIRNLDLSNNSLVGTLDHWKNVNMSGLVGLALDQNRLTGELPALTAEQYPKLQQVYLSHNKFTGYLTANALSMENLTHVDLSHNQLRGEIPSRLFDLPKLKVLDLNSNMFYNMVYPTHENTVLELLALQENYYNNQILPTEISNLRALKHLDLTGLFLEGTIPSSIAQLTHLENLFLARNRFTQVNDVGEWLPKLTNLKEVSLKRLSLSQFSGATGPIPDLSGLKNLTLLDLQGNAFTSSIPSSLGSLNNLRFLLLNENRLDVSRWREDYTHPVWEYTHPIWELPNLELFFFEANAVSRDFYDHIPEARRNKTLMAGHCGMCRIGCKRNYNNWVPNFDPAWQHGFQRQEFVFGPNATFAVY